MDIELLKKLRERLNELLRRHVREEDTVFTDDEFVKRVLNRYELFRQQVLIDPNE